ncbi:hypothetical protein HPB48_017118 [Haemaphysalis longicornis]|uniref:PiggyBac transposable element-derived protein domain-containing protein n=1 Tax=Haemaphysalis longicornis TaxID=44386 RepID=A0A9J6G9S6_HAELO|nr:hypothetical protein HPB48_017118 [Haemaphysalis longicornis]
MVLYMSVVSMPFRRMYWSRLLHPSHIADCMPRNRFDEVISLFHACNNDNEKKKEEDGDDKLYKVRPLLSRLKYKFQGAAEMEDCLAVDEMIIPYLFECRPAPILSRPPKVRRREKKKKKLTSNVGRTKRRDLLLEMRRRGLGCTATMRNGRIGRCPLKTEKCLKGEGRGYFDFLSEKDSGIIICHWHNNGSVTIGSNTHSVGPVGVCRRYDKKTKEVSRSSLVRVYNQSMGGVDRADQLLSFYHNELKTKKWYKRIVFHLLDLAVVNSWLLYRAVKDSEIQLAEFKVQVAFGLMKSEKSHEAPLHDSTMAENWLSNRASHVPTSVSMGYKGLKPPGTPRKQETQKKKEKKERLYVEEALVYEHQDPRRRGSPKFLSCHPGADHRKSGRPLQLGSAQSLLEVACTDRDWKKKSKGHRTTEQHTHSKKRGFPLSRDERVHPGAQEAVVSLHATLMPTRNRLYNRHGPRGGSREINHFQATQEKPTVITGVTLSNTVSSHPDDIKTCFTEFFTEFYRQDPAQLDENSLLEGINSLGGQLPQVEKEIGENFLKPTSEQELLEVLKNMKSGSSPGPDGLPKEFYRTYRPILGSILVELVVVENLCHF